MLAENVDDARLKRKLSRFAKKNFAGDKKKAASFLLEKAIDLSDVIDWKRFEQLARHEAFGMWADREDMKDSVAWVNASRKVEENHRRRRHEAR